jgi:hypothetical protein
MFVVNISESENQILWDEVAHIFEVYAPQIQTIITVPYEMHTEILVGRNKMRLIVKPKSVRKIISCHNPWIGENECQVEIIKFLIY